MAYRPSVAVVFRLTWSGQEFADAIANATLWDRAKTVVLKPAGAWTFGVLLDFLKSEIKDGLGKVLT